MDAEPSFAADLYRDTAEFYDRFRPAYPPAMTEDLLGRVRPSGRGRLLDLACGTGHLAFALRGSFAETWAVDQEPDMVRLVEAKAARRGQAMRAVTASAEELSAEASGFELITIGNAFHRLRRDRVAGRAYGWLRPGGHLALCWSRLPWTGDAAWQEALNAVLDRWRSRLNARDRIPQGWASARLAKPDQAVLVEAGFAFIGRHEFEVEHRWTVPELAGLVYSTSFLAAPVFGELAPEFEAELADQLAPHGVLAERVSFAYDLFRTPAR